MFGGLGRKPEPKKRRGGSTLTTALFVSGGAAALAVALVGYELVLQKPDGALPDRVADGLGFGGFETPLNGEKPRPGEGGQPLAAVAACSNARQRAGRRRSCAPTAAQSEAGYAEIYADGVRRVEAKDNCGVDIIKEVGQSRLCPGAILPGQAL